MGSRDLLIHKSDTFTQNGEDGIIAAIFEMVGTTTKTCCEFGAWDGIHLSNCRRLILQGWSALMIEGDENRYQSLMSNYASNPLVSSVNRYVGTGSDSLGSILKAHSVSELDFLSIDIDGLDYEVLETLDIHPRVICIEVNGGHSPEAGSRLERDVAKDNVGQPLQVFVDIAHARGYDLVCFIGNAFFVRRDVMEASSLPSLSAKEAYQNYISDMSMPIREWLYLVNLGIVNPYFQFANPYATNQALGIGHFRAFWLRTRQSIIERARPIWRSLRKPEAND